MNILIFDVATDDIVGFATTHEQVEVGGGVAGDAGNNATPILILLACGFIGAGMAVMAFYDRLFARPMMQQH